MNVRAGMDRLPVALVVDDDEVFRNRLCRALEARGWRVGAAADSAACLRQAAALNPDLAVIDLRLPGPDGIEIVRELRRIDERVCIIMLTGYGSIANAISAIKLGASHYLSKPADVDEILACYQEVTRGSSVGKVGSVGAHTPSLARAEWEHMQRVLADCGGNISQTATRLGLHRRSLQRKLRKNPPGK